MKPAPFRNLGRYRHETEQARPRFEGGPAANQRVAIGDGVARTYDVDWRMRVGVTASDLDYVVETEEHTTVTTTRDARR